MRLIVFHYHLLAGGVTGVIAGSLKALLVHQPGLTEVVLVAGSRENAERVVAQIDDRRVTLVVLPQIGYTAAAAATLDVSAWREAAQSIRRELERRFSGADSVWWVHNYHLGKNPAFTRALLDIADDGRQRMLLQIHDFPECGRYENVGLLHRSCGAALYPLAPQVHYATINQRDHDLLLGAGIPARRLFLVPNPVASGAAERQSPVSGGDRTAAARDILRRLAVFAPRSVRAAPDGRLLLYPVRAIRRKNLFEAGLISRLMEEHSRQPCHLVLTLPGVSQAERGYSALVQQAFERGTIRGYFGVGTLQDPAAPTFAEITASADMVISSSVQEGFGYTFFDPLRWGVALLARHLDTLQGFAHLFDGGCALFYDKLEVPLDGPLHGIREQLSLLYHAHLETLREALPCALVERIRSDIEMLLRADTIDFSFLGPGQQVAVLEAVGRDPGLMQRLIVGNGELLRRAAALARCIRQPREDAVECELGPAAVAERLAAALAFSHAAGRDAMKPEPAATPASSAAVHAALLDAFAQPSYARLLYCPYP